jgi:tetratricopeptide (TPR) repeat protein
MTFRSLGESREATNRVGGLIGSAIASLVMRAVLLLLMTMVAAQAAPLTSAQALAALELADRGARLAGIERLAEIGKIHDADRIVALLGDDDPRVQASASEAIWRIWGRSGDAAIDKLYARGVRQMQDSNLVEALATFNEIVRRKPAFAEGWNKRATIYFALGDFNRSLKDCDEVLKRNPNHFGAMAGAGQMHLQMGNPELALKFFRRAVEVNPTLEGPAQVIPMLERFLADKERNTT